MEAVGFTTTIPVEVLLAAGRRPVDLNNVFINAEAPGELIRLAELDGYPRTACAWIDLVVARGQALGDEGAVGLAAHRVDDAAAGPERDHGGRVIERKAAVDVQDDALQAAGALPAHRIVHQMAALVGAVSGNAGGGNVVAAMDLLEAEGEEDHPAAGPGGILPADAHGRPGEVGDVLEGPGTVDLDAAVDLRN